MWVALTRAFFMMQVNMQHTYNWWCCTLSCKLTGLHLANQRWTWCRKTRTKASPLVHIPNQSCLNISRVAPSVSLNGLSEQPSSESLPLHYYTYSCSSSVSALFLVYFHVYFVSALKLRQLARIFDRFFSCDISAHLVPFRDPWLRLHAFSNENTNWNTRLFGHIYRPEARPTVRMSASLTDDKLDGRSCRKGWYDVLAR